MSETTGSEAEQKLRETAEEILYDDLEIVEVKTIETKDRLLIKVSSDRVDTNAFAGYRLEDFLAAGYVPTSVAASKDHATAWFKPVDIGIEL